MEATAKYDYTAAAEDELSFKKGEQLKILQTSGNWYKAELHGVEGYVPQNFISFHFPSWYQERLNRTDAEQKLMSRPAGAFLIRGSKNAFPGDFSISVRHPADVQHFKVLRNRRGQYYLWTEKFSSLNQLVQYYKNNSVSKQSQVFLQETQQEQRSSCNSSPSSCPPLPTPRQQRPGSDRLPPSGCPPVPAPRQHPASSTLWVRALYSFHAEEEDELEFNAGDVIEILDCSGQAWWKGRLRGNTGLFPSNYAERI